MKSRDIVIGVLVLVLLGGIVYWRQKNNKTIPLKVPETLSTEKTLEDKFKIDIPEDVDKAELKDISGGNGSGIATKDFKDGKFTSSVIVDLPAPGQGEKYQAWLSKDDGSGSTLLGTLRSAKGGYMLDYKSDKDMSDLSKVNVTLEKKLDNTPEKTVLEAKF
jgi:hypothetical protein